MLASEPLFTLDYADYIDEETFLPPTKETRFKRAIVAGWVNGVRLLDNMPVKSEQRI
jgi:pantoate--beta-alanine ligase